MLDRIAAAGRALRGAPAYAVVEGLAAMLATAYSVTDTVILLVDYRLGALLPLGDGPAVTHPGSPEWTAFDRQAEVVAGGAIHLPVTVRGDRLGVLRLRPVPADAGPRAELAEIASLLGHELAAARSATDRYLVASRARRLTLAAEMQWELLPGRSCARPAFDLAGQLEPAYTVRGDSFDWADDADRLFVSVINGSGEGVEAAGLTALATSALRNARRAGLPLPDQASLADQALYSAYAGTRHVAALLLELTLATGALDVVDAGSPRLFLLRGGEVRESQLEEQFPLGMFDGTIYRTQRVSLTAGDRAFVISDGVFDAASQSKRYGESALDRFLRRTAGLGPLDAVRSLLGELRAFVGGDLIDDAVVVCLDYRGQR